MSQVLSRAIKTLTYLSEGPRTVSEIARHVDVHPSTALRFVQTLHTAHFVERQSDRRYRLGAAIFGLATQALENLDLRALARPPMEALRDRTGETVHLGILENGRVVYIEKVESQHPVRMYSRVGFIAPLHCTGVAKAILAFLPAGERRALLADTTLTAHTSNTLTDLEGLEAALQSSRKRGYAVDDEEHEKGIHCIAAPILHANGSVAGSLSVSVPMSRLSREQLHAFLPDLLGATSHISAQLGFQADRASRESAQADSGVDH